MKYEITNDMFKGYFVPTPIQNKYFSMEKCELVDIEVDWDSVKDYWHTGDIINLVYNEAENKYFFDESDELWFWYKDCGDGTCEVIRELEELSRTHFNNDKFRKILSELYKELLEGKTYVGTMNSYMFMQRFSYIGDFTFD